MKLPGTVNVPLLDPIDVTPSNCVTLGCDAVFKVPPSEDAVIVFTLLIFWPSILILSISTDPLDELIINFPDPLWVILELVPDNIISPALVKPCVNVDSSSAISAPIRKLA